MVGVDAGVFGPPPLWVGKGEGVFGSATNEIMFVMKERNMQGESQIPLLMHYTHTNRKKKQNNNIRHFMLLLSILFFFILLPCRAPKEERKKKDRIPALPIDTRDMYVPRLPAA